MTPQDKDRIQNAINHIKSAVDVDEWAAGIAVEAMEKQIPKKPRKAASRYFRYACPSCGYYPVNDNYCCYCGQAIDFGG